MIVAAVCAVLAAALVVLHARLELRRSRARAEALAQRFHAVFDSASLGIAIGVDGRMLETNRALQDMLGYSGEELREMHFADITHPDDIGDDLEQLDLLLRGELDLYRVEKRYFRRDGEVVWGHVRISLARDEQGKPAFAVGMTEDITARKKLEEQLRHSQKMEAVGSLAGGVAHDFNNVLTAIGGYCEILLGELEAEDLRRRRVTGIQRAVESASALTRQLLTFSRKNVLKPQFVDLNDVVAGIEPMLRRLIREDVRLRVGRSPWPLTVLADPGQLDQVLLNLALNASDAMPHGGELTIGAGVASLEPREADAVGLRAGRHCYLSVADTGLGMDPETQKRVFEPFFTTKPEGLGTGLGLSTVYGIVTQSGGAVSIASTPGRGSVFTVFLPERLYPLERSGAQASVRTLAR